MEWYRAYKRRREAKRQTEAASLPPPLCARCAQRASAPILDQQASDGVVHVCHPCWQARTRTLLEEFRRLAEGPVPREIADE